MPAWVRYTEVKQEQVASKLTARQIYKQLSALSEITRFERLHKHAPTDREHSWPVCIGATPRSLLS